LVATLAILLATALILLVPHLREHGAFGVYLIVVSLITWFGGWKPGALAIALAGLFGTWFVIPPANSLRITNLDDAFRLGVFVAVAALIASLHASHQRARDAAWQTEQRLAFALESAHMGAWYSDLRKGTFWCTQGLEEIFGRPPGDFSATYEEFVAYIHPEDQDFVKRAITHTIEGGQEFEIEHRIVRPNGQTRWLTTRGRTLADDSGNNRFMLGVVIDVTEQKAQNV
jgi:PAS domain S-box-containing protein